MKNKSLLIIIFLSIIFFSESCFIAGAQTTTREEIINGLHDLEDILDNSGNDFLFSNLSDIKTISGEIESTSSIDCNYALDETVLRLSALSTKIKKKRCKSHSKKAVKCVPNNLRNETLDQINLILEEINASDPASLCTNETGSDSSSESSSSSSSSSSGSSSNPIFSNPGSTLTFPETIKICSQTFNTSNILMSTKLDSKSEIDTKLDLGKLEFYSYSTDGGNGILVKNTSLIPLEIKLELSENTTNVSSDLPKTISIPPNSEQLAFDACIVNPNTRWTYNYTYLFKLGSSTNTHTGDGKYLLPYKPNEQYKVVQGETGTFSHFGEFLYSIDFGMPQHTEITAMRKGQVVFIKQDSNEGGPDKSFLDKANFIWILHEDGSVGKYVHLEQNGSLVKLGDVVNEGDVIGYSGNTGYTTEPHLHIQVVLLQGLSGSKPMPIRFKNINGALEEGKFYRAESIQ